MGGTEMRNAYQHVMIGVFTLIILWVALTTDFHLGLGRPMGKISQSSPPHSENLANRQTGPYYHLVSEEIGRSMVPSARSLQW